MLPPPCHSATCIIARRSIARSMYTTSIDYSGCSILWTLIDQLTLKYTLDLKHALSIYSVA